MIATDIVGSRVESDERSHEFGTRPEYHAALIRRLDAMVLWIAGFSQIVSIIYSLSIYVRSLLGFGGL